MTLKPSRLSGVIILALAGAVGYQMIYLRTQRQIGVLKQELTQAEQAQALRAQLAASLTDIERFRKRLPPEPETGWLLHAIGSLAQETDIQLTTILPQPPKPLQDFTYLAVNLQFTTSYRNLAKLLDLVEHANAFIRVDEVELARTPQETAQVKLVVSTLSVPALTDTLVPQDAMRVPAPHPLQPQPVSPESRVRP